MRSFFILFFLFSTSFLKIEAQLNVNGVYSTQSIVGWSVIGSDSIKAKTIHFTYPIYDCSPDTLYQQVLFSTRQKGEAGDEVYLNKGGFASVTDVGDTLKWKNESALYDIDLYDSYLFVSNNDRTVRFNRDFGYDEQRFPSRMLYAFPGKNLGLFYSDQKRSTVSCLDLMHGETKWSAPIPSREDWLDIKLVNDSVCIIAAAGLHAINIHTGLLWTLPLQTAVTNSSSLVYAVAKHKTIQEASTRIRTSLEDNVITQLGSNILIKNDHIFFAASDQLLCMSMEGKQQWTADLSTKQLSKCLLMETDSSLMLVNFGIATHGNNLIIRGIPFVLDINLKTGDILDEHDLGEITNLADFMMSERGLSFGSKKNILEIRGHGRTDQKMDIPLNITAYGEFAEFIDASKYYVLEKGRFTLLNSVESDLLFILADNNKVYGLKENKLIYEHHFSDLYRLEQTVGDRKILKGLTETIVTDAEFKPLGILRLPMNDVVLWNKLYFIDKEKVHIVNLNDLK